MTVAAPDPVRVREASLARIHRIRLPLPPPNFPLVWEPGDRVDVRPVPDIEARAAILNVVLARSFGMPPKLAMEWLLGIAMELDPLLPSADGLLERLPNLPAGESFTAWRRRTLSAPRSAPQAAAQLDLYYCLDWSYLEAERRRLPLPGLIDSNTIGQRRWALEWGVIFTGPYHGPPPGWEEIDLST